MTFSAVKTRINYSPAISLLLLLTSLFFLPPRLHSQPDNGNVETVTNDQETRDEQDQLLTLEEKENLLRELSIKRAGFFAFGLSLGLIPDLADMSVSGPNLRKINLQMANFANGYSNLPSNPPSGFESYGELTAQSKSVLGIPVQLSMAYYGRFLMYKLGLSYVSSTTALNSVKVKQYDPTNTQQSSYLTGNSELELSSHINMSYFEIPLTMAVRIVNVWASSFYIGLGPSYFAGGWKRVSEKNSANTVNVFGSIADADVFFAQALGVHFLIGGEVFISRDIAIIAEMQYSYGASATGKDSVLTKDAETVRTSSSLLSGNDSPDIGAYGYESTAEQSPVQFGGFAIQIGVRFIL